MVRVGRDLKDHLVPLRTLPRYLGERRRRLLPQPRTPGRTERARVGQLAASATAATQKTETKQEAEAKQANGLIQAQPEHPSFPLAKCEGGENPAGSFALCRTRPKH